MRKKNFKLLTVAALVLTGFFLSCNNSDLTEQIEKGGSGTVAFKITDAPFPANLVEEANVTVDWIKVFRFSSVEEQDEVNEDDVMVVELEEPAIFNLMDLRNGIVADMAEIDLPAGKYAEIRLHIIDAGIVLKDGTEYTLKVPGGDASGLKIKLDPELEVEAEMQAEVLFDFDLNRSFVMQGNINNVQGFIFKPVVRAVANVLTSAGEVSGIVVDEDGYPVGNASLTLYDGEEAVTSAITSEDDGYYAMVGILPGDYTLVLEVGDYRDENDVVVEAGATTEHNFLLSGIEIEDDSEIH